MNPETEVDQYIQELAEKYSSQLGEYPEPPHKDSQLQFMRDVVDEEDSFKLTKTANLNEREAGETKISVLDLLKISRYAESEGYNQVAEYLRDEASFIAAASLGRKAKLLDTTMTVRRETRNLGNPKETTKKGLFGSTTVKEGGD